MSRAELVKWPLTPAGRMPVIERAAALILEGDVVAFPTDTVYGLGAHAWNGEAIQRLYAIKERPAHKAIALLISGSEQLVEVTDVRTPALMELARRFWPGGLTVVVPWTPSVPVESAQPFTTVGVRVPNHPIPLSLIARLGVPLATTSANLSGAPSAVTAEEVDEQIGDRIGLIIDGGTCPGGRESTVVDLTVQPPAIRRQGAIPFEDLASVLKDLRIDS